MWLCTGCAEEVEKWNALKNPTERDYDEAIMRAEAIAKTSMRWPNA
jgi:hypothetical protein